MRLRKLGPQLRRLAIVVGLLALVVFFFWFGNDSYVKQRQQAELLVHFTNLDASDIKAVKFIPGHTPPLAGEVCLTIENPVELKELATFFPHADNIDYGGHQTQQFRFRLVLEAVNGHEEKYLIRTYDRHPSDIFVNVYAYEILGEHSYSYSVEPEIRIPGLYPWFKERVVRAGCAIDENP